MPQFLKEIKTQPTYFHALKREADGTLVYVRQDMYGPSSIEVGQGEGNEMIPTKLEFNGNGVDTVFDINFLPGDANNIEVWVGQTRQQPSIDYNVVNDTVVFDTAPTEKVYVLYIDESGVIEPPSETLESNRNNLNRELINIGSIYDQYKLDVESLYYYINNDGELVARRAVNDVARDTYDIL